MSADGKRPVVPTIFIDTLQSVASCSTVSRTFNIKNRVLPRTHSLVTNEPSELACVPCACDQHDMLYDFTRAYLVMQ